MRHLFASLAALLVACNSDALPTPDASVSDASPADRASSPEGGVSPVDANNPVDAAMPTFDALVAPDAVSAPDLVIHVPDASTGGGNALKLAQGQPSGAFYGIAVANGIVYVADNGNDAVLGIPVAGGAWIRPGTDVGPRTADQPWGVACDAQQVYWSNYGSGNSFGAIMKCPLGQENCAVRMATVVQPSEIAVAGGRVFVTATAGPVVVNVAGGPATPLVWMQPQPTAVAAGGGIVCFAAGPLGGTQVFAECFDGATLVGVGGGNLAGAPVGGVAVEGNDLALVGGAQIIGFTTPGTNQGQRVIADHRDMPGPIATDGTFVYWLEVDALIKAPLLGGVATVLATATGYVPTQSHIALDDANVYWTAADAVMMSPKSGVP